MKKTLLAGLSAAFFATALMSGAAVANSDCSNYGTCEPFGVKKKTVYKKAASVRVQKVYKRKVLRTASVRKLAPRRAKSSTAFAAAAPRGRGHVVAMIKSMAPRYGVPAWFALRIAHVESGYNPTRTRCCWRIWRVPIEVRNCSRHRLPWQLWQSAQCLYQRSVWFEAFVLGGAVFTRKSEACRFKAQWWFRSQIFGSTICEPRILI